MYNKERTLEEFGYDLMASHRRTKEEFKEFGEVNKKNLKVIDNCPSCNNERTISLRASRKNRLCIKCFHNTPEMINAKINKSKFVSEETRKKMSDNHFLKHGGVNAFKGAKHTDEVKAALSASTKKIYAEMSQDEKIRRSVKASCTLRSVPVEEFTGWVSDDNLRARGLPEYKVFEKACLARDMKCTYPGCDESRKDYLTVHHKDGFHWCIDRRHDVDNGITLCHTHHRAFHSIYLCRDNTESQYVEWLSKIDS